MVADMAFNLRGREPRPNRIEVRLTNAELDRLNNLCTAKDESAAALIRMALDYYIDFHSGQFQGKED